MKARLVEFEIEQGETILIAVEEAAPGMAPASAGGRLVAAAGRTFDAAIASLVPATDAVVKRFRSLDPPPDACEIEFGVTFAAEGKAVIAAGSANANFRVKVMWKGANG